MEEMSNEQVSEPQEIVETQETPTQDTQTNLEKDTEVSEKKELPSSEPKIYKARSGDKEIDLPGDAFLEFESKKGEKLKLTVEELRSDAYGKQEISRRLNEIDKLKKEQSQHLTFAEQARKILETSKGPEKIEKLLSQLRQYDPSVREAEIEYHKKLYQEALQVRDMSPEQREMYFKDKELSELRSRQQMTEEGQHRAQMQTYMADRAKQIEEKSSLPREELQVMYDSYRQELQQAGQLDSLTLDKFFDNFQVRVQQRVQMESAYNVLKEIDAPKADRIAKDPMNASNPDVQDLLELYSLAQARPDLTKEQLRSKAEKLFGKSKLIEEANKKLKDNPKKPVAGLGKAKDFGKPQKGGRDINDHFAELKRKYGMTGF